MQFKWQKDFWVFLFVILFSGLWFFREIFQGYLFYYSDINYYFYPYRLFLANAVKAGSFPLWNPYIFAGYPFFATLQAGVLYPINILLYFFPFDWVFNFVIIIHYPLAFISSYLLCRDLRISRYGAMLAGLVFAFSGFMLSVLHMPTTLAAAAWMPLLVMFFRRTLKSTDFRSRINNTILTSLMMTLMFLGGEPTVLLGTLFFIFLYICYLFVRDKKLEDLKGFLFLFVSGILFLLLTSIQILPFLELVFRSIRGVGITFAESSLWSLEPRKLLNFIIPYLFHYGKFVFTSGEWASSFYMSFFALFFAVFSFFFLKKRRIVFSALVFSLVLVLGNHTPFYHLFFKLVPFFGFIRYPQKFLIFSTFFIALLAGFGFDEIRRLILVGQDKKINLFLNVFFSLCLSVFVVFVLSYFNYGFAFSFTKILFMPELRNGLNLDVLLIVSRNIANAGILCLFLSMFYIITKVFQKTKKESWFAIAIILLVLVDLFISNRGMNVSMQSKKYHQTASNIEILKEDPDLFRVYISPALKKDREVFSYYETINFEKAIVDYRNFLLVNQNMLYDIQLLDGYESIVAADIIDLQRKIASLNTLDNTEILNMLNSKYLLSPFHFDAKGYVLVNKTRMQIREKDLYLYRNDNYLPRAFIVPAYKIMKDRKKILSYITENKFKPLMEVVLEEKIPGFDVVKKGPGSDYNSKISSYTHDKVVINTSLKKPGILFLSDHFYPGWKAYVDGKKTTIYRANYMFRAVPLSAGNHSVVFSYDPLSFRLGAFISFISILGIAGYCLIYIVRLRKTKKNENK
ncbi:MAG: YfhO family protein [Candidatus Saganbacteria bacterium]|nr:YfhO family protein [Candidatus Saganbacteria bacterium]